LGEAKVGEGSAFVNGQLAVGEDAGVFRFGNGGGYDGDEGGMDMDGGVDEEGVRGAKVMNPSGNAAGVGAGKVGSIGVDAEQHVGGTDNKGGVRVGGGIAEEAVHFGNGGSGGVGLEGGEGGDSGEHSIVDRSGIIKDGPYNAL